VRREVWSAEDARVRSKPEPPTPSDGFHRPHVNSALLVSALSVAWTVVSSSLAVTIGVRTHTAVLVAFGAIGIVDAIGSVALAYHFQHGLRHDRLSDELEKLAHRVVLVGLFSVGCASVLGGLVRLAIAQTSEPSNQGVALAAISGVALIALSARKQQVARRIASKALLSDGHLSAVGATQAAVTLTGTAMAGWLGWYWADAAATTLVGSVAIWVSVSTWRTEHAKRGGAD
jgi:divalent metal cation (Fe/Co/Zn/Cd) transporter